MRLSNRAIRIEGYLNNAGETYPGGNSSQLGGGDLGNEIFLTDAEAQALTDTSRTITRLRQGFYQRVLSKAGSTASPAAGIAAYWDGTVDNLGNYIVTPDNNNGIFVGFYLDSVAKGTYCWIQTGGVVNVKCASSITKGTPAIGDVPVLTSGGLVDVLADATTITWLSFQNWLGGKMLQAAAANAIKLALIPHRTKIV